MTKLNLRVLCALLTYPTVSWCGVEVIREAAHDVSPPLRSIPIEAFRAAEAARPPHRQIPLRAFKNPSAGNVSSGKAGEPQSLAEPLISATVLQNFDGVGQGFTGPQGTFTVNGVPPDPNGAIGATQYVQWVNTSFAVFDKGTGAVVYGPVPGNSLWSGFGGQCERQNDGDPIVLFDHIAGRWVFSQFAVSGGPGNYYQCVAVSTTSDATGSYNRYAFAMPNFNDYAKITVWPDAYYMSFNLFNGANGPFVGGYVCALNRTNMLAGIAATAQCFQLSSNYGGLLPSDLDGPHTPPTGSPNYYLAIDTNSLDLWSFHVDFTTPSNSSFTGPTSIPVNAYSEACGGATCIPQPGTSQQLDSLGDRLMHRLVYRNFGSHEVLVANHSVDNGGPAAVRWYEIRDPGGTPTVYQQGTFAPDTASRWMGSLSMDAAGDIAVGYSTSSGSNFPSVAYTGRLATDPLGALQAESVIISGMGSQQGVNRWGDYSGMTLDPVDDCTFWYTNEYLQSNGQFNWNTRIASFKFPGCIRKSAANDFNGDGMTDIIWRQASTGATVMWLMNGGNQIQSIVLGQSPDWSVTNTGDFNGDGKTDLIWRQASTGATVMWLMNGGSPIQSIFLGQNPDWSITNTGDFNGDGKADIIWRQASTGATVMWLMNGGTVSQSIFLGENPDWSITNTGDFNGDGKTDLIWRQASTGATVMWLMNGGSLIQSIFLTEDPDLSITNTGDFNGDGKTDIIWRRASTGATNLWLMNSGSLIQSIFLGENPDWSITNTGDFNGDGKTDVIWRQASTGDTYMRLMDGGTVTDSIFLGGSPDWRVATPP